MKFDLQMFADEEKEDQPANDSDQQQPEETEAGTPMSREEVEKMIQSETDRVRQEYSKRLKDVQEEKDKLENEKLTAEEKLELEAERRRKALEEKEQELTSKELRLKSYDVMKKHQIPDELQDVLLEGIQSEDQLLERGEKLADTFSRAVDAAVSKELEKYGREPHTDPDEGKEPADMSMDEYAAWFRKKREESKPL